jgi:hypothetical protein
MSLVIPDDSGLHCADKDVFHSLPSPSNTFQILVAASTFF